MDKKMRFLPLVPALVLGLGACGSSLPLADQSGPGSAPSAMSPPPDEGAAGPCADSRAGYKNAYFGDTHTHTSYSIDAYFFNALSDPRTAHRYAKGAEPAPLPAKGSQEIFTLGYTIEIDRPLDFNAVSDHAEFLGGLATLCNLDGQTQQQCDRFIGQGVRDDVRALAAGDTPFHTQLLQSLLADAPSTLEAWARTKQINDEENEPCVYTTLHAYEYTSNEIGQMLHRNVIFKGAAENVPADVFPAVNATTALAPQNGNDDWDLFDHLELNCTALIGCQALTIPHNANRSDGRMFLAAGEAAGFTVLGDLTGVPLGRKIEQTDFYQALTVADAELRRAYDRSYEMTQHKGQSECAAGAEGPYLVNDEGYDPNCDFEVDKTVCAGDAQDPPACAHFCTGDPGTDPAFCGYRTVGSNIVEPCLFGGPDGRSRTAEGGEDTGNCMHVLDYYRNAMAEGLLIKQSLGINPYRMNITAALDTHSGDSGNAKEWDFTGHGGVLDDDPREQLGFWACDDETAGDDPNDPNNCGERVFVDFARALNPGGLGGVWAAENTRDAIWDALHSGESFGTSGTRLRIRSIASWQPLPADICAQLASGRDLIGGQIVSEGAAMGGDLPPPPAGAGAPYLAVYAVQDPEGYPLQQLDLIKGYINMAGEPKLRVYSAVAATTQPVNLPSPESCAVEVGNHPESLCAQWRDPEFDPASDSFWYARALEVPSCRWTDWLCNVNAEIPVDCGQLDASNGVFPEASGLQGFEGCCEISEHNGQFSGEKRFSPIRERAWASPIWYERP